MSNPVASKGPMSAQEGLAFQQLEALAKEKLGFHFSPEQRPAIRKRMLGLARKQSLDSLTALLTKFKSNQEQYCALLADALSTNHTAFFRESVVLRRIPAEIIASFGRGSDRHRIWSAASSTGEEAYSVAILLAEAVGIEVAKEQFSVLGTDLVRRVVDLAEVGEYPASVMKGVSPERQQRWFKQTRSDRQQVDDNIRKMCTFRQLNLIERSWPFTRQFSVILCRNVLYYFDRQTQTQILSRMYRVCEPGGWLLTSVSETLHDVERYWHTLSPGVHRKFES